MNFKRIIRSFFKKSKVFNFNTINRNEWIEKQAKLLPDGSLILDAGAGSCPYFTFFSHCEYKSQDFTQLENEQLSHQKYGEIDYVCDITSIPADDNSFDAILCSEVLEHVPEPVKVLEEFSRILRPGGKIILTAPLGSGIHQEPFHFYGGYTPFWYEKYLTESGFEKITIEENAGSLQSCGQESMRFVRLSRPFSLEMPFLIQLLWLPVWSVLAPIMFLVVPSAAYVLNKYEKNKDFTIGYHVTAELSDNIVK